MDRDWEAFWKGVTEKLAAHEHQQWAHWTAYMLTQLEELFDFCAERHFEPEAVEHIRRWQRQIRTPYEHLSEEEKESDREWARKALVLLTPYIQRVLTEHNQVVIGWATEMVKKGPPPIILDPESGVEFRLAMDRMVYGNSFQKAGTKERVDPRHVLLKDDGTFEIREP